MATGSGALVTLELLDRVVTDPVVAHGEPHHVPQGAERAGRGLLRAAALAQAIEQVSDVRHRDLANQTTADHWQHVAVEVVAVDLERPHSPLTAVDATLVALKPPAGDGLEPQAAVLRQRRRGVPPA